MTTIVNLSSISNSILNTQNYSGAHTVRGRPGRTVVARDATARRPQSYPRLPHDQYRRQDRHDGWLYEGMVQVDQFLLVHF